LNKLYFGNNLDILHKHNAAEPTRPMKEEAVSTGFYDAPCFGSEYPKLQILTIEKLMLRTGRPRFPDLTLGRLIFKREAGEDMVTERWELLYVARTNVTK
jgi:hypothetical protein